jgi:hypothetical protein
MKQMATPAKPKGNVDKAEAKQQNEKGVIEIKPWLHPDVIKPLLTVVLEEYYGCKIVPNKFFAEQGGLRVIADMIPLKEF